MPNDGEALPRRHGIDRGQVVEDPSDHIRAVESRGGTSGRGVGGRGMGEGRTRQSEIGVEGSGLG